MAADVTAPGRTLETLRLIKARFPEVNTIMGLSNVSFGLPKRTLINAAFLSACVIGGLDAAIMDPTLPPMLDALYAAGALSGRDEYCMGYMGYIRGEE